jgi:SSS family solute:Na+ symporter
VTLAIILAYLGLVLAVGLFSRRLSTGTGEDWFLATRNIGPFVLLMTLFGTHMTAFSLLGASGEAYRNGIGVFALMASSSAIVVPAIFYFVGLRLWRLGKKNGYVTQVQFFRDRFQSDRLGLLLFVVLAALLIPYLLIGVLGGGLTLNEITGGSVPQWAGSLMVCAVVMVYVSFGGLRGTAWANTLQTIVFIVLGGVTFFWIVSRLGGLEAALDRVASDNPDLLIRGERVQPLKLLTYAAIPMSVGMFPHIFMHWLTARREQSFRLSFVGYPICVALVWLPSVLLGVIGTSDVPGLHGPAANSILVLMIDKHAPELLAGLLAAGVFAAIMSSLDSQSLSLGSMFTQDIVRHYRKTEMDGAAQVRVGRLFVLALITATFLISLVAPRSIFKLGIWSFTGYASLLPLVVAAIYWKRATRDGAIASVLTVAALWSFFFMRAWSVPGYTVGGTGVMPVAVILVAGAVVLVLVSLVTRPPERAVLDRFFGESM